DFTNCSALTTVGTTLTCGSAGGGSNWNVLNGAISPKLAGTLDLLIGGQSTASAKFAFINVDSGTPTASIAGTANNALSLNGNGTIGTTNKQTLSLGTAATGDINLVIGAGNNLRINGVAGANVSANCVNTTNGIVTSSATCPSAAANFIWQTGLGAIFEGNTTQDLLIGSQATSSAKFAVINVNSGTPVASVSAGITGGAFFTADGQFQTTAKQSLTLGGGNTGNIILGNNGFTSCSALESINGVITCGTDDVGSAGTNYWQLNSGALSPYNESLDLLLGSAATGSAEFAITGIAAGTPTASISATTNNNGISLTGSTSTIQSLNMGSLTIGGNTTGNVILSGRNGSNTGIYFQGYNCNGANGGALTVDSTGLVQCSADDSSTGAGPLNIKEDNLAIVTGSNDINFLGSDFTVTDQGGNQGGVAIDYNGSGITRKNNAEVI